MYTYHSGDMSDDGESVDSTNEDQESIDGSPDSIVEPQEPTDEIPNFNEQIGKIMENLTNLEVNFDMLESSISTPFRQPDQDLLKKKEIEINNLKTEIDEIRDELQYKNELNSSLKDNVVALTKDNINFSHEINKSKEAIDEIKKEKEVLQYNYDLLENRYKASEQTFLSQKKQIENLQKKNEDLETFLKSNKGDDGESIINLQNQIEQQKNKISKLKNDYEERVLLIPILENENEELKKEIKDLMYENDQLSNKNQSLTSEITESLDAYKKLKEEISKLQKKNDEMTDSYNQQIQDIKKDVEDKSKLITNLKNELAQVKNIPNPQPKSFTDSENKSVTQPTQPKKNSSDSDIIQPTSAQSFGQITMIGVDKLYKNREIFTLNLILRKSNNITNNGKIESYTYDPSKNTVLANNNVLILLFTNYLLSNVDQNTLQMKISEISNFYLGVNLVKEKKNLDFICVLMLPYSYNSKYKLLDTRGNALDASKFVVFHLENDQYPPSDRILLENRIIDALKAIHAKKVN